MPVPQRHCCFQKTVSPKSLKLCHKNTWRPTHVTPSGFFQGLLKSFGSLLNVILALLTETDPDGHLPWPEYIEWLDVS